MASTLGEEGAATGCPSADWPKARLPAKSALPATKCLRCGFMPMILAPAPAHGIGHPEFPGAAALASYAQALRDQAQESISGSACSIRNFLND